jgi:transposase-like protein
MAIKKITCRDCGKDFEAKVTSRYSRKYCDKCSKKRKEEYENLYSVNFEDCED